MDTDKNSCANDRQLFMCVPVDTETDAGSGGHLLHAACLVLCLHGSDMGGAKHGYGLKDDGRCRM